MMESGGISRRRTSTTCRTSDEDLSVENEKDAGLLNGINTVDDLEVVGVDMLETDDKKRLFKERSRLLRPLGLVFPLLLLVAIAIVSYTNLLHRDLFWGTKEATGDVNHGSATPQSKAVLGIQLHPKDHVSREAKTIFHRWTITSESRSPDGVKKNVYLVNGEFPGPLIECRSGDHLVIRVRNSLALEGVSIHWHGIQMRNANSMDGAVGFTQCPVPPGGEFIYEFDIDEEQSGSFWWHAHSQVQRGDGMYGGLVVHRPSKQYSEMSVYGYEMEYLLLVGDWYHRSAEEILAWYTSARGFGNEPVPDSLLINGVGKFLCAMAVPARPIECIDLPADALPGILESDAMGHQLRIRIVNVGTLAGFSVRTTSGTFEPLIVDGGSRIHELAADSVGIIYPGERLDVLYSQGKEAGSDPPLLEISLDPENFRYPNPALQPNQSFSIFPGIKTSASLTRSPQASVTHFDLSTATSNTTFGPNLFPLPPVASQTILLYTKTQKLSINGNRPQGFVNRTTWAPQSSPPLPLISLLRSQWDINQLVPYIPNGTWVDIIINNLDDGSHPFHLHGHDFYVLATHRSEHGWGSYSPYANGGASGIKPVLNLENPVRKDTVSVPRRGYVILRVWADNVGIWMLHCHVLFHLGSGMGIGLQVGGDQAHSAVDEEASTLCSREQDLWV